jgi:hypothetical protein
MIRRPLAATLCSAALLALAACGQATQASQADDGGSTAPTSASTDTGTPPGDAPDVPASGCEPKAVTAVDYAREPQGYATPEEAASAYNGLPDGTLMMAPADGRGTRVWIVDTGADKVTTEVSVIRGTTGWYVDAVTTCA